MEESATETGGVSWADSLTVAVYSLQCFHFFGQKKRVFGAEKPRTRSSKAPW